jgi:hypothetical protein
MSLTNVDGSGHFDFFMQTQEQQNWCWAAVSASVAVFFDPQTVWAHQCDVVNAELGQNSCCQSGSSKVCDQPWYLDRALQRVGHFLQIQNAVVPFGEIQQAILNRSPLCARIAWPSPPGAAHFIVMDGWEEAAGIQSVEVADPLYGGSLVNYLVLQNGYQGNGTWTDTYFTTA